MPTVREGTMPTENALTLAEWSEMNGYDRSTGTYGGEKRSGAMPGAHPNVHRPGARKIA